MRLGKLRTVTLSCVLMGVLATCAVVAGGADAARRAPARAALRLTTTVRPSTGPNHVTIVRLRAANPTATAKHGVVLTYDVPQGQQVVSAGPGCSVAGSQVTCTIGIVRAHSSRFVTIILRGPAPAPGGGANTQTAPATTAGGSSTLTSAGAAPVVVVAPLALPACTRTFTGTFTGSIVVRPGETVCIVGATIRGSVVVQGGGGLSVVNSTIIGSIYSNGATFVSLCGSPSSPYAPGIETTAGSVTILNTSGPVTVGAPPGGGCSPNEIGGTLTLRGNRGGTTAFGNTIGGGLAARSNIRGLLIGANTIDGSLTCGANVPPPTNGGAPNNVVGTKTGQCAAL